MSDLRTRPPRPYAFPAMAKLDEAQLAADRARQAQLETVLNDAVAKGLAQGVAQGRLEVRIEAQRLLEQSRQQGLDRGYAEGLEEMRQSANALREALAEFEVQRTRIVSEAEAFCVDLALAIVARLVADDSLRAEFVVRSVKCALKALAPENPSAVFLNPKVSKHVALATEDLPLRDDENLSTGSARVETGRLVVESAIDEAFEQIRSAVLELKANRQSGLGEVQKNVEGGEDASDE